MATPISPVLRGQRIVLFDTLIARLAPAEIEAVLAHELGHFKHHTYGTHGGAVRPEPGLPLAARLCHETDWFYAG